MSNKDARLIFPKYTKTQVRKAGDAVRSNSLTQEQEKIIENWRSSHNHILNTWLVTLLHRIQKEHIPATTGQRLKRKNTIYDKLKRDGTSAMSLPRMYDIAGCRVVFDTLADLYNFRDAMLATARFRHKRIKKHHKDYITKPKNSGYRGIHDIYEYKADPRRPKHWDGLFVEIQYRTKYQHAWSTAVEVSDIVKKSRTKFSDKANVEQNKFFQYASEIIARTYESSQSCCKDMSDRELVNSFIRLESKLGLLKLLESINVLSLTLSENDKRAIIIWLHIENDEPNVVTLPFKKLSEANKKLFELEKEYPQDDIVLVKSDNAGNIRNVFKNYFTDAIDFVKYIKAGLAALNEGKSLTDIGEPSKRIPMQLVLFED